MSKNIAKGQKVKDATGRWATVVEVRDNVIVVDKFHKYIHVDNVVERQMADTVQFWTTN